MPRTLDLKEWETRDENQIALRRLVILLESLRTAVRERGSGGGGERQRLAALYDDKGATDTLRLFELGGERTSAVPIEILGRFWREGEGGMEKEKTSAMKGSRPRAEEIQPMTRSTTDCGDK